MTTQEYDDKIERISRLISSEPNYLPESDMALLRKFRPERLGLSYLEAKLRLIHPDHFSSILEPLYGKMDIFQDYTMLREALILCQDAYAFRKSTYGVLRHEYILRALDNDKAYYDEVNALSEKLLSDWNYSVSVRLHKELHGINDHFAFLIHKAACDRRFFSEKPLPVIPWVRETPNMALFLQWLESDYPQELILIEDGKNSPVIRLLKMELEYLEKTVIYLATDAASTESSSYSKISQTLLKLTHDNPQKNFLLLSGGELIDKLTLCGDLRKKLERLTGKMPGIRSSLLSMARLGDYLTYLSGIYDMDCHQAVDRTPDLRFSIIVPARNSAFTLRYTLQTCLEQSYTGEYEIIVGDNSTGYDTAVYELCMELQDPRIRYIKTPRDLHLPKSFEFAFLHARGEYILSLGSDDGLLPWALEVIDKTARAHPDEEILQWERGFYAWPGFNGGQQNQFIIPRKYGTENIRTYYRDSMDYLASVLVRPDNMYSLPMLYINSCFKRSYFRTLLDKTGRLWDGMCQDIYMGIVTACIKPRILNLRFPLAMAGMSSGSVGETANTARKTNAEYAKIIGQQKADANMGAYCRCGLEYLSPNIETDVSTLYESILRAVNLGFIPEEYLTQVFDWKNMFRNLFSQMDIRDVAFDRMIHQMRYAASLHGESFLSWFDETIYAPALVPRLMDEKNTTDNAKRSYAPGRNAEGGITLDASEYGVSDIHGAVQLVAEWIEYGDLDRITENDSTERRVL